MHKRKNQKNNIILNTAKKLVCIQCQNKILLFLPYWMKKQKQITITQLFLEESPIPHFAQVFQLIHTKYALIIGQCAS